MRNVQVIDGAPDTTVDIFVVPERLFDALFPDGADVAFIDHTPPEIQVDGVLAEDISRELFAVKADKKLVAGIHGTLHLRASHVGPEFFPNRRETDVWPAHRSGAERLRALGPPSEPIRNVQIYDGASNATFGVVGVPARLFDVVFPGDADVAFLDLLPRALRGNGRKAGAFWSDFYSRDVDKRLIHGVHGTLHYDRYRVSPQYFPNRKEADVRRRL
jgi:hypothetical protein